MKPELIFLFVVLPMVAGCTTWNAGRIEPKGEPNRLGYMSKSKVSESVAIAEETTASIGSLPADAHIPPTCSPNLDPTAQLICVVTNSMALQAAYLTGAATTAAGEVAQAGQRSIIAVAQGLTARSQARWRAATLGLSGLFAYKTANAIGENNAAIAQTVAQNGGIRIGSIQQSSSRHGSGAGGEAGEGTADGAGGANDGQSLNQLVIGNNNAAGLGTDNARISGATNHASSIQAEPSATVATFQNTHKPQGVTTADELEAPVEVSDDDGGQSLF